MQHNARGEKLKVGEMGNIDMLFQNIVISVVM